MSGSQGATYGSTAQVTESNSWKLAAAADFNGDGVADLLWENTSNGNAGDPGHAGAIDLSPWDGYEAAR